MTESEWLGCADPKPMLEFLWRDGSHRKLRLFACACCRRVQHLLTGEDSRIAVDVAERHADGLATDEALIQATGRLEIVAPQGRPYPNAPAYYATWYHAPDVAASAALAAVEAIEYAAGDADGERAAQVASLRDIFGNPFRPVTLDPAWQSWHAGIIVRLARAVYEDRVLPAGTFRPDRVAVLADALEEAGCQGADILGHCRRAGPHIRGCWLVDLLTGRE
jgi:hypothetical protein